MQGEPIQGYQYRVTQYIVTQYRMTQNSVTQYRVTQYMVLQYKFQFRAIPYMVTQYIVIIKYLADWPKRSQVFQISRSPTAFISSCADAFLCRGKGLQIFFFSFCSAVSASMNLSMSRVIFFPFLIINISFPPPLREKKKCLE